MEAKVRVKVIRRYNDLVLKAIQEVGAEFETTEKRADHLVKQGMVKILSTSKIKKGEQKEDEKEKSVQ